jgi:PAS domain S-box-containing protein
MKMKNAASLEIMNNLSFNQQLLFPLDLVIDRSPITINHDRTLKEIFLLIKQAKMQGKDRDCVVVLEGDKLAGILTLDEMGNFLTEGVDIYNLPISAVMNSQVPTVTISQSYLTRQQLNYFSSLDIAYLPVLSPEGKLEGLLTAKKLNTFLLSLIREDGLIEKFIQEIEAEIQLKNQELREKIEQLELYIERLNLALEGSKVGVWDWDMITNKIYWTPQHEIIFGYPVGIPERNYNDWRDRVHPDDIEVLEAEAKSVTIANPEYHFKYRIIWPDGSLHWIRGLGRFYYDENGQPLRVIGLVYEITEQVLIEQSLRENEERLKTFFNANVIGLIYSDSHGRVKEANNEFLRIVRCDRQALAAGKLNWIKITSPDSLPKEIAIFEETKKTGICVPYEKEYLLPDGSRVPVLIGYGLVGEKQEDAVCFVLDLSPIKLAEKQLHDLNNALQESSRILAKRNQELERFAYVISHDLKAPLRAIANLSEWLEEDLEAHLTEETQHNMQLLRQRVYRLNAMIEALLDYSRIGLISVPEETVNVTELLQEIVESLAIPPNFIIEVKSPFPTLLTKRLFLSQVFSNLINNAIKHHHHSQGHIEIQALDRGDYYEFSIKDNGPGIAPEYQERIFDIFQILTSRDQTENTGIGLSIVKKIIDNQGERIWLDSREGEGATFYFTWHKNLTN